MANFDKKCHFSPRWLVLWGWKTGRRSARQFCKNETKQKGVRKISFSPKKNHFHPLLSEKFDHKTRRRQDKTKTRQNEDKTRQNKTRQNKTRRDKTRQEDETRRYKKTRQEDETRKRDKTRWDMTRQDNLELALTRVGRLCDFSYFWKRPFWTNMLVSPRCIALNLSQRRK